MGKAVIFWWLSPLVLLLEEFYIGLVGGCTMLPLFECFRFCKFVPYLVSRMSFVRDSRARALIELYEFMWFTLSLKELLIFLLLNNTASVL